MAKPQKCIPVNDARSLYNNWQNTRANVIKNSRNDDEDECCFVYSVEELQEFLDYVKEESKKQGITNPGVRIYFGAYDTDQSNCATVFLAPTKGPAHNAENNYTIEAMNYGGGGRPPMKY